MDRKTDPEEPRGFNLTPVRVGFAGAPGANTRFRWVQLGDGRRFSVRSTGAWVPCPGRRAGDIGRIWSLEIEWRGAPVHRFIIEDGGSYFVAKPIVGD